MGHSKETVSLTSLETLHLWRPFPQAGLSAARVAAPPATVSGSTVTVSGSGSSDAAAAATQALVVAEGRRQLPLDLKQLLKLQRLGPCHCIWVNYS